MGEWSGDRFAALMVAAGISVAELVCRIRDLVPGSRISRQHVVGWIRGTRPNADYLAAIARALEVSIDSLMGMDGSEEK